MATANPIGEDNYELELNRVRNKIITTFHELTECLKKREQELLKELDVILACYHSYKLESDKMKEKKIALQHTKSFISQQSNLSPIQNVHEDFMARLNTELETIAIPNQPQMMYFVCNTNILDEVKNLGELIVRERTEVDYKSKLNPVVSVCDRGRGLNNLDGPKAVTVDDTTGNIFVADTGNSCVKVFDDSGKIIYKFGDEEGEGKMSSPRSLSIHGNNIVISQYDSILNYQLNGKFISRIGKSGKGKLEFNLPHGLTFNQNGDLYICDSNNNRVQILSKEFVFKDQFGQNSLKKPCDVKLTRRYIYILDESNPCLHLFDYNLILQKGVLSRGKGFQLINPLSCYIDNSDNILVPDSSSNSICIFNPEFDLIHRISIASPTAVTVDKQGRIFVVCQGGDKRLYIF